MSTEKITKRKIQAIETKTKIYSIAIELIGKEGYDNVSIDQICEKAEVSKGTFYHHFNAKEDIILAMYKDEYECFLKKAKDTYTDNTLEEIVEVICFHVRYAEEKGVDIVKQVYKSQLDYGTKLAMSKNVLLQEMLTEIIHRGQRENEIRKDKEAQDIIDYVINLSHGIIYNWCLNNGSYSLDDTARISLICAVELLKQRIPE